MNGFTKTTLARRAARLLLAALAVGVLGAPMTGCANDKAKRDQAALMAENTELRDRNTQLESAVTQLEQQRALLEGELRSARSDSRGGSRGTTGFGGVSGVTAERLGTGEVLVTVANDILFDSGKATLKASAKTTLDQVAGVLNSQYADRLIQVAGFTDTDPIKKSGWKTNERLSAERALAVEEYLASKGVSNDSMFVSAFGSANPKGTKKDSRRVEILVLNAGRCHRGCAYRRRG